MKHTLILLLLWAGASGLWAQVKLPKVNQGPDIGLSKSIGFGTKSTRFYPYLKRTIGGSLDDGYICFDMPFKTSTLVLYRYDQEMKQIASGEILLEYEGKELNLERFITNGDRILVVGSMYDRKAKKKKIILTEVNSNALNTIVKQSELISYDQRSAESDFNLIFLSSPDQSKTLISTSSSNWEEDEFDFNFWVFDQDMNELWHKTVEGKLDAGTELERVDEAVTFDRKGNVIFQFKQYPQERSEQSKQLGIHFWVVREEGQSLQKYFYPGGENILDLSPALTPNGSLYCAGLYQDKANRDAGIIKLSFTPGERSEFAEHMLSIPKNDLVEKWKPTEDILEVEIRSVDTDQIILRPDGGCIVVNTFRAMVEAYPQSSYYYGDVVVTSLDPEGQLEWCERIEIYDAVLSPKAERANYVLFLQANQLWFIFNDIKYGLNRYHDGKRIPKDVREREIAVKIVGLSPSGKRTDAALIPGGEVSNTVDVYNQYLMYKDRLVLMGVKDLQMHLTEIRF